MRHPWNLAILKTLNICQVEFSKWPSGFLLDTQYISILAIFLSRLVKYLPSNSRFWWRVYLLVSGGAGRRGWGSAGELWNVWSVRLPLRQRRRSNGAFFLVANGACTIGVGVGGVDVGVGVVGVLSAEGKVLRIATECVWESHPGVQHAHSVFFVRARKRGASQLFVLIAGHISLNLYF